MSEQWTEWARGQAVPAERLDAAVDAALRVAEGGAGAHAAAAAARLAGGRAVAGAAAVGASGLRALFGLVQHGLLFVAFGAAAMFLLGLGAALAALRDRVCGPLGTAWRGW